MIINLLEYTSSFAENKDTALKLRKEVILPELMRGNSIILDFEGVESATQSFIHALLREVIRKQGIDVLDDIIFKNCNEKIKKIITIVVDYIQEA